MCVEDVFTMLSYNNTICVFLSVGTDGHALWLHGQKNSSRDEQDSAMDFSVLFEFGVRFFFYYGFCVKEVVGCCCLFGLYFLLFLQGYCKYSIMFYGYYNNQRSIGLLQFRLPLSYLLVGVGIFGYSLMVVIRT